VFTKFGKICNTCYLANDLDDRPIIIKYFSSLLKQLGFTFIVKEQFECINYFIVGNNYSYLSLSVFPKNGSTADFVLSTGRLVNEDHFFGDNNPSRFRASIVSHNQLASKIKTEITKIIERKIKSLYGIKGAITKIFHKKSKSLDNAITFYKVLYDKL